MALSRRKLIAHGAAGAVTSLTTGAANSQTATAEESRQAPVPTQVSTDKRPENRRELDVFRGYDMRDDLTPRRLTMAMWDVAFALRHGPGGKFRRLRPRSR